MVVTDYSGKFFFSDIQVQQDMKLSFTRSTFEVLVNIVYDTVCTV